jgi:hypothetical protein
MDGMTMKALLIGVDGVAEVIETATDLDTLKGHVGGWLEGINGPTWHAYIDEEGKIKGGAVNEAATLLLKGMGWRANDVLVGPVIIFGNHPAGDESRVPDQVLDFARELGVLRDGA